MFRVPTRELLELTAAAQLLQAIEPRRVQQPISRDVAAQVGGNQRFGDEGRHMLDELRSLLGRDRGRRLEREIAGKDRKAAQRGALRFQQQLVAPIQGGSERLVSRQSGTAPPAEKPKTVVELIGKATQAEGVDAPGGELD